MLTKLILSTLVFTAYCGISLAGTASISAGKNTLVQPSPEPYQPLGLTFTAGYDSTYLWHGRSVGENLISQRLEYSTALTDKISLNLSEWSGHLLEYTYNELDLAASLSYNMGPLALNIGYTRYQYLDGNTLNAQNEPYVKIATQGLSSELFLAWYYETEVGGSLLELGASKTISVLQNVNAVISGRLAYNAGLTTPENGLNHASITLAFPIALTQTLTLTPYVSGNFALDALKGKGTADDNIILAGAALSVRF